jgi:hypothetical protein
MKCSMDENVNNAVTRSHRARPLTVRVCTEVKAVNRTKGSYIAVWLVKPMKK